MNSVRQGSSALEELFPGAVIEPLAGGVTLVSIPHVPLPVGWSRETTPIWFVLPNGYPAAQPDCFWAAADLRLGTGSLPANSGLQQIPGRSEQGLWFSWHLACWRPGVDDVVTFTRFVLRRLSDAR